MIVHQTVGVAPPIEARHNLTQADQIHLPIIVVKKDIVTCITACSDVVNRAGEFELMGAGLGKRIAWDDLLYQDLSLCCALRQRRSAPTFFIDVSLPTAFQASPWGWSRYL